MFSIDRAAASPAAPPRAAGVLAKVGWALLALLATVIAVYSMRYGLPVVPQPHTANFLTRRPALTVHALAASVALLVGPWQFLAGLRARRPGLHRALGRIYVVTVLVAWLASIPIGLHAETGMLASAGFTALGAAWIVTTGLAVERVMRGDVAAHRRWMVRSYALTAAAITLRILLPAAFALQIPHALSYPAIAWLCWVPNLLVAEWWLRRSPPRPPRSAEQSLDPALPMEGVLASQDARHLLHPAPVSPFDQDHLRDAPGLHPAASGYDFQRPVKMGGRFSALARRPSA